MICEHCGEQISGAHVTYTSQDYRGRNRTENYCDHDCLRAKR
jgi:hypothetical protein